MALKQLSRPGRQGQPDRLRRRRGRYRLLPQVRHQLRAVVDRRRHPLRPEQALWRRVPRFQDRPDLLQHHGRCRRCCPSKSIWPDGHGRRDRAEGGRSPGKVTATKNGTVIAEFSSRPRCHPRRSPCRWPYPLIIGRGLTTKAREALGLPPVHPVPPAPEPAGRHRQGYSLAQKMVGRACGLPGRQACCPAPTASPR